MSILEISNLKFTYGSELLFNEASLRLFKDDHLGLVGLNGVGKSTLFNLLIGKLAPDSGTIKWLDGTTYSYLDQYLIVDSDVTIKEYLYGVYKHLFDEEKRMNDLYESLATSNESEYQKILSKAERIATYLEENNFYAINSQIDNVIQGLGINVDNDHILKKLSSGQRSKVFLGKILLEGRDVLLLDEPTNFLDIEHVEWLTKYLQGFPKAYIVISHDVAFLNNVTNSICELSNKTLTKYKGNFNQFVKTKEINDSTYLSRYLAQQKYIKKTEEFIAKNIVRATTTKRAQSRRKQLEKIQVLTKPNTEKKVYFDFKFTHSHHSDVVRVKNLEIGYTYSLLHPLDLSIRFGEKIVLLGENGIGKSTFIKTILGLIPPISGTVWTNELNDVYYYEQELLTIPDCDAVQFIKNEYPLMETKDVRTLLGKYGVTGETSTQKLKQLSGGELTKVRFALLSLTKSNLLILDEPTNHLDRNAKESLFKAISDYPGTVLLVSHEKEFYQKLNMKELRFK